MSRATAAYFGSPTHLTITQLIMEKKEYIKPEVEEIALNTVQMIATSSMGLGEGYADEDAEVLATGRRGKWGNLWYKEE